MQQNPKRKPVPPKMNGQSGYLSSDALSHDDSTMLEDPDRIENLLLNNIKALLYRDFIAKGYDISTLIQEDLWLFKIIEEKEKHMPIETGKTREPHILVTIFDQLSMNGKESVRVENFVNELAKLLLERKMDYDQVSAKKNELQKKKKAYESALKNMKSLLEKNDLAKNAIGIRPACIEGFEEGLFLFEARVDFEENVELAKTEFFPRNNKSGVQNINSTPQFFDIDENSKEITLEIRKLHKQNKESSMAYGVCQIDLEELYQKIGQGLLKTDLKPFYLKVSVASDLELTYVRGKVHIEFLPRISTELKEVIFKRLLRNMKEKQDKELDELLDFKAFTIMDIIYPFNNISFDSEKGFYSLMSARGDGLNKKKSSFLLGRDNCRMCNVGCNIF